MSIGTLTIDYFAVLEFPDILCSIGIGPSALTMVVVVLVFPDILSSIGKGVGTVTMPFVVLEFPDIL